MSIAQPTMPRRLSLVACDGSLTPTTFRLGLTRDHRLSAAPLEEKLRFGKVSHQKTAPLSWFAVGRGLAGQAGLVGGGAAQAGALETETTKTTKTTETNLP